MVDVYEYNNAGGSCFPLITGCHFENNYAAGLANNYCSQAGSGFCRATGGAGILLRKRYELGAVVGTITNCDFIDNVTSSRGGGLGLFRANGSTVRDCRFIGNICTVSSGGVSSNGGGISVEDCSAALYGCLIVKNSAAQESGGVSFRRDPSYTNSMHLDILGCTITDNSAPLNGGLGARSDVAGVGTISVSDSIIWGNSIPDFGTLGPMTMSASYCNLGSSTLNLGPSNLYVDPLFVSPDHNDYHLSRNSPLVDSGDPLTLVTTPTDMDGGGRIVGPRIDIGIDEVPVAPLPGSNEDLEMHTYIHHGNEDPNETLINLSPGDLFQVRLTSAGNTFVGSSPLIVGQAFTTGIPPVSPPGLPGIHLDGFGGIVLVYGDSSGTFLMGPSLDVGGVLLPYLVPPGLSGFSFRMQGFAVTGGAANGQYAVTEAHDLEFL